MRIAEWNLLFRSSDKYVIKLGSSGSGIHIACRQPYYLSEAESATQVMTEKRKLYINTTQ